jgi:hypothetical protein
MERSRPTKCDVPAAVNDIGTALESLREATECDIEHSTHQQRQSPACKLIA